MRYHNIILISYHIPTMMYTIKSTKEIKLKEPNTPPDNNMTSCAVSAIPEANACITLATSKLINPFTPNSTDVLETSLLLLST